MFQLDVNAHQCVVDVGQKCTQDTRCCHSTFSSVRKYSRREKKALGRSIEYVAIGTCVTKQNLTCTFIVSLDERMEPKRSSVPRSKHAIINGEGVLTGRMLWMPAGPKKYSLPYATIAVCHIPSSWRPTSRRNWGLTIVHDVFDLNSWIEKQVGGNLNYDEINSHFCLLFGTIQRAATLRQNRLGACAIPSPKDQPKW